MGGDDGRGAIEKENRVPGIGRGLSHGWRMWCLHVEASS